MPSPRVRVYLGCSLDGCIAGPGDDLSFLEAGAGEPGPTTALTFEAFMAQVGCMLMGRRTYDVVQAMGAWPYGDLPVLVATSRALEPAAPTIRRVSGDIAELIHEAKRIAGDKDVYLDGGAMVRHALDAGLVDELCLTLIPIVLGDGVRLFDGLKGSSKLEFVSHDTYGGMVQVTARVVPG